MSHCESVPSIDDEEIGKVVQSDIDFVLVERLALEGCKSCSMGHVCGSKNSPQLKFKNSENLQEGDIVVIHIDSSTRLLSSFIIFILPILILVAFFCVSRYIIHLTENTSIAIGFLSLALSVVIIMIFDKYISRHKAISISKK